MDQDRAIGGMAMIELFEQNERMQDDSHNNDEEDDYEAQTEKEEREDALDSALENIGRDKVQRRAEPGAVSDRQEVWLPG